MNIGLQISIMFFLFSDIFIKNMQFMYICIRLNILLYELQKLHFLNFFFINKILCKVSKFPPHALIVGMAAHDLKRLETMRSPMFV